MKSQRSETELLQILATLSQRLEKGQVSLRINDVESLQLTIENDKMDLNFLQKEQLRTLLKLESKMEKESILKKLVTLKNLAEKLRQKRFTIKISYKGQEILTLGYEAKPAISQIVTGTDAIEFNNLVELLNLIQ